MEGLPGLDDPAEKDCRPDVCARELSSALISSRPAASSWNESVKNLHCRG